MSDRAALEAAREIAKMQRMGDERGLEYRERKIAEVISRDNAKVYAPLLKALQEIAETTKRKQLPITAEINEIAVAALDAVRGR